jgi:hypothetical protein
MIMNLKICYLNDHFIEIELIDHSSIKAWFNHFKNISNNAYQPLDYHLNKFCVLPSEFSKKDNYWKIIKNTLNQLEKLGYKIPFRIPQKFNYSQTTLNLLHRFFTFNAMWFKEKDQKPNPFDCDFKLKNMNWEEWFSIIDQINYSVHKLESLTRITDKRILVNKKYPLQYLHFFSENSIERWLEFDNNQYQFNYNFFNPLYENCNVILDESILGKSIFRSFYDDDNPSEIDRSGRYGSFGGFFIDVNQNRKKLYNSLEFKNWLKKFNLDPSVIEYEFPIGKVSKCTQPLIEFITKSKPLFEKIEFIEN